MEGIHCWTLWQPWSRLSTFQLWRILHWTCHISGMGAFWWGTRV